MPGWVTVVIRFHDIHIWEEGVMSRSEEGSEPEDPTDLPGANRSWGMPMAPVPA